MNQVEFILESKGLLVTVFHDDRQTKRLVDLWPVFVWMFFFMMSNGVGMTVMPVLAVINHMPNSLLGTIGSIYFAGMFLGYFIGPPLVRKKGYRFSGLLLLPLMCIGLVVLLFDDAFLWAAGRSLAGLGIGISYIIAESWVAGRAHSSIRMTALSIYIAAAMLGILSAQALLTFVDPASTLALLLGGAMIVIASVLIGLVPLPPTGAHKSERQAGHALRIVKKASVPLTGVFVSGLLFSIFVTFYATYGANRGLAADLVPLIGVVVMAGATFMQPLLGRVLERKNPIQWLIGLAIVSALAASGLVYVSGAGFWLYLCVALWGAAALTTYPLYGGLAYSALADESVFDVARAILVSYGVAEIIAPPLMGAAIDAWGVNCLFGVAAAAGILLAGLLAVGGRSSRNRPDLTI